ncbi:MAG: DUF3592 domain-containing protein [Ruminococcus sp.]|nr:DUF3592 domain-containing protein [Ruminococcus sp.]
MEVKVKKTGNPKIVGVIFVICAVIFIIVGIATNYDLKGREKRCTESVTAEVVENIPLRSRTKSKHGYSYSTTYKPVFNFEYGGTSYRVESNVSRNPALFEVGEKTEIKVNPTAPEEIYVPADKTAKFIGTIFIAVGAVFLVAGILVILKVH